MLTSIDRLKRYKNVIVLTTSNITGTIDLAFVDRADMKVYVGTPNLEARYEILRSCVNELLRVGIISGNGCEEIHHFTKESANKNLIEIARLAEGLSGRSLRKMPLKCHTYYIRNDVNIDEYMVALKRTVQDEHTTQLQMKKDSELTFG